MKIPREAACECVDMAIALGRKIHEEGVTMQELMDGFTLAVESGHDMLSICLSMASIANEKAAESKESLAIPSAPL